MKFVLWLVAAVVALGAVWAFVALRIPADDEPAAPDLIALLGYTVTEGAAPGYVEDRACATCHEALYASYQHVGMARSFARPRPDNLIEDFADNRFYHARSKRHYEMARRDGRLFFKRYQLDDAGQPINVFEREVDWIVGSGNKTRSYLYQTEAGELYQLPIGWYTETQQWGMAPGYDIKDHLGIQRTVRRECMFCHNAYPDVPEGRDVRATPHTFPTDLPEGTGCQRCHGPGADHIRAALTSGGDPAPVRAAIVNPARLAPERRDEVCFQCHLLPAVSLIGVRRFDRPDYSFRPGEALSDYLVHVDPEEAERPRSERFEINHHAYRLRQSACFQKSAGALTCITCHNPHRKVPPQERVAHYGAVCLSCHAPHTARPAPVEVAPDDCVACHMPQRRTQDVVQVVMTDHAIGRHALGPHLTAPIEEGSPILEGLAFLDPETAPEGTLGDVYLATALVRAYPNARVVDRLEQMLDRTRPEDIVPYFDLARGQLTLKRYAQAEETVRYLLERQPDHPQALEWLAVATDGLGKTDEAIDQLRRVVRRHPDRPEAHYNLGLFLSVQGRDEEAVAHFSEALALRPNLAAAWFHLGVVYDRLGRLDEAVAHYRRALAVDPTHDRAYVALGQALMQQGDRAEALRYWRHGLKVAARPGAIADALVELEEADRENP